MKLRSAVQRLLPFVLTLSIGIVATSFLSTTQTALTEQTPAMKSTEKRMGSGSSSHGQDNGKYHDFSRPFVPPVPASEKSGLRITFKPQARYTELARANNVQGKVRLKVVMQASGEVGQITVVDGLPDGLTEQAVEAARKLKFTPAMKNGVPVPKVITIDYSFTIY